MKPAPFGYYRPETVEQTVTALAEYGSDAVVLAGGQSLLPLLNQRRLRPKMVIDINRLPDLDRMVEVDQGFSIGALLRQGFLHDVGSHGVSARDFQSVLSPLVAATNAFPTDSSRPTVIHGLAGQVPLLGMALEHVGHIQTRHRGTIAGSIAYGDPMAELPLAWLVCGGSIDLVSTNGTRTVGADDFFDKPFRPDRRDDELVTGLTWHRSLHATGHAFEEVAHNVTLGIAAAVIHPTGSDSGTITIRLGIAANAGGPRLAAFDDVDPATLDDVAADLAESAVADCEFVGDVHADERYRRHLARTLADRAIRSAFADTQTKPAAV